MSVSPPSTVQIAQAEELQQLIARVALADRAAFSTLYQKTSPKLFGVTLRILVNRQEAEDALQEAYVKVWNRAATFAPMNSSAGVSPMGWLIAIARNQAIDVIRARKGGHVDIDEAFDLADQAPGAEAQLSAKGDAKMLADCLSRLETDRAEAVRKAYLDGWSYQELADTYKVPLNTMRTWLRRSLMKLKECLET
jgi:RNA polymerase sigma-70 factor, ECF subfamily